MSSVEKALTLEGKETGEILLIHVLECDSVICCPAFRTPHSAADSVTTDPASSKARGETMRIRDENAHLSTCKQLFLCLSVLVDNSMQVSVRKHIIEALGSSWRLFRLLCGSLSWCGCCTLSGFLILGCLSGGGSFGLASVG